MKVLALDIGDKWIGVAISDPLKITCKPYGTVGIEDLEKFIKETLQNENVDTVVVGISKTLKGENGEKAEKVIAIKEKLEGLFNEIGGRKIRWVLWDERLSSKRAQTLQQGQRKIEEKKLKEHSLAAAFILQSYLDSRVFESQTDN